jgi:hypothetical protein
VTIAELRIQHIIKQRTAYHSVKSKPAVSGVFMIQPDDDDDDSDGDCDEEEDEQVDEDKDDDDSVVMMVIAMSLMTSERTIL